MSGAWFEQRLWAIVAAALDEDDEAIAELTEPLNRVQNEVMVGELAGVVARQLLARQSHAEAVATVRAVTAGCAAKAAMESADG